MAVESEGKKAVASGRKFEGEGEIAMLDWTTEYDAHDNTVYVAQGPYQDEDGGAYYFRINPVLVDNTIKFKTGSTDYSEGTDDELIPFLKQETFDTLGEAKAECQRRDDEIRAELERFERR